MSEEDVYYEVEHIVDVRQDRNKLEVKIKWLGFNQPEDDTWEPFTNLNESTCLFFLREFRTKLQERIVAQPRGTKNPTEAKMKIVQKIMKAWKVILEEREIDFNDSETVSLASLTPQPQEKEAPPSPIKVAPAEPLVIKQHEPEAETKKPSNEIDEKKKDLPPPNHGKTTPNRNCTVTKHDKSDKTGGKNPRHQSKDSSPWKDNKNEGKSRPTSQHKTYGQQKVSESFTVAAESEEYKIKHKAAQANQAPVYVPQMSSFGKPPPPPRAQPQSITKAVPERSASPKPQAGGVTAIFHQLQTYLNNESKASFGQQQRASMEESFLKVTPERSRLVAFLTNTEYFAKRVALAKDLKFMEPIRMAGSNSTKPVFCDSDGDLVVVMAEKDSDRSQQSCKMVSVDDLMLFNPGKGFQALYNGIAQFQGVAKEYLEMMSSIEAAQVSHMQTQP